MSEDVTISNLRDTKGRFVRVKPAIRKGLMRADAITPEARKKRSDGWVNILTGLGRTGYDKRLGASVEYVTMKETECEQFYAADDVAARFVNQLPEDATREWLDLNVADPAAQKLFEAETNRLSIAPKSEKAWKWGRLYGGAAIMPLVDDGTNDLSMPLDLKQVRLLKALLVLQRFELQAGEIDADINSTNYGMPLFYSLQIRDGVRGSANQSQTKIHYSRLIRFEGAELPLRQFINNQYWNDSILVRAKNPIMNYQTSHDAVALILQEFNQGVFKMQGLADIIGSEGDSAIQARLLALNLGRSVARALLIDAEGEEFTNIAAHVNGVPDILEKIEGRLVAASKQPRTLILGESPKGLNSSGENERKDWYDYVSNQQDLILRPALDRIFAIMFAATNGPFKGKMPKDFGYEFRSLWQVPPKEQAEVQEIQSRADERNIMNQIVSPQEIALSRFGSGKFKLDTQIDVEARDKPAGETDDVEDQTA